MVVIEADFLDDSYKTDPSSTSLNRNDWGQKWIDGRMIVQLGPIPKPFCSTEANPQVYRRRKGSASSQQMACCGFIIGKDGLCPRY